MADQAPRPLIGLTAYRQPVTWGAWHREAAFVPATYLDVVVRAGGQPVVLPPLGGPTDPTAGAPSEAGPPPARVDGLLQALRGLVLVGGGDVDPAAYGQFADPRTEGVNRWRDDLELALVREALAQDLPLLAVCRGAQVLNVARGGDLVQHLPERSGTEAHRPEPGAFGPVVVTTEPGSLVRRLCGEQVEVRCSHHQALDRVGRGLRVTARSADGVVEAVELEARSFVLGVQWHPEEPGDARLFEGLVEAARRRGRGGSDVVGAGEGRPSPGTAR